MKKKKEQRDRDRERDREIEREREREGGERGGERERPWRGWNRWGDMKWTTGGRKWEREEWRGNTHPVALLKWAVLHSGLLSGRLSRQCAHHHRVGSSQKVRVGRVRTCNARLSLNDPPTVTLCPVALPCAPHTVQDAQAYALRRSCTVSLTSTLCPVALPMTARQCAATASQQRRSRCRSMEEGWEARG